MKKMYMISFLFMLVMSIGLYICYNIYGIGYADPEFSGAFLPTYYILVPFSIVAFLKYRKGLAGHSPKYIIFMFIFIPVIAIAIFTMVKKFELSMIFFLPLIDSLFVGTSEELIYRGVVFTNVTQEKGLFKGIFISALAFSILHSINIIGGISVTSMLVQLIDTFLAGIFFAAVYYYTKNIVLLIIFHAMWDYVLFTDVPRLYPFVGHAYTIFLALEIIIVIILLMKYRNESQKITSS